ncbi:MAG: ABC transporter permease [Hyphomicrobiaceae bacterium]
MKAYVLKRLLLMVPTLLGAAFLVFLLMRLVPGDICQIRLSGGGAFTSHEALAQCRAEIGLDEPFVTQFVGWISNFMVGDFGKSMWTGRPVAQEIAGRLAVSIQVALMATILAVASALPMGVLAAIRQNSWIDYGIRLVAIGGIATPSFWLGILMIVALLNWTQAFTGTAWMPPIDYVPLWKDPLYNLSMLIWPALAIGYRFAAVAMRMTRSSMLEVMREDYVRTARAKGLLEWIVVNRHGLKNALLPVVTIVGIEFAFLMGGLVVTEQVFNLNGIGRLFVASVTQQDYTMTQALVMLVVAIFVVTNFIVDLTYAWLDPRIRYR